MKRLIVLHPHFMKEGGASRVVLELTSRLAKNGWEIVIITQNAPDELLRQYSQLRFVRLKGPATSSLFFWVRLPFFVRQLRNSIENHWKEPTKPILFCHSLAIYWAAFYQGWRHHAIVIYYLHDLGLPYLDSASEQAGLPWYFRTVYRLFTPLARWIRSTVTRSGDYVIANSQTSAKAFRVLYGRETDVVIYPGVNSDIFVPTRKKEGYIYAIGRLEPIKKMDTIIQSFALFTQSASSRIELRIVGDGSQRAALTKLASNLGVSDQVIFEGSLSQKSAAKLAAKARVGIFLCPTESFGLAAAETASAGTPLVGVRTGGIAEIVQEGVNGTKCSLEPREIAKKIKGIYYHLAYSQLCRNARLQTVKTYSWDASAQKLDSFLGTLT